MDQLAQFPWTHFAAFLAALGYLVKVTGAYVVQTKDQESFLTREKYLELQKQERQEIMAAVRQLLEDRYE